MKVFSAVPDSPGSPLAPFVTDGGRLAPGGPWTPGSPLSPLVPEPPGVPSLPGNPGSPGEENVRIRDIRSFVSLFCHFDFSYFCDISDVTAHGCGLSAPHFLSVKAFLNCCFLFCYINNRSSKTDIYLHENINFYMLSHGLQTLNQFFQMLKNHTV